MTPSPRAVRREQRRQAWAIHGGLVGLGVAALGVHLARLPLPTRRLRTRLFRTVFGTKYPPGLNEAEMDRPIADFPTLNALFTRGVRPECRPIPAGTPQFLSPCDGTVQDVGRVEAGRILTLKRIEYTLESLFPGTDTAAFEGGHFAVVFLSPIDCHRVFAPQDGELHAATHVPGARLLVHPPFQRAEFPVYTLNERVTFRFTTPLGPCALAMVAGWGVGNITLPAAPDFRPRGRRLTTKTWGPPLPVRRGDWVATFELGSTVVLVVPPAAGVAPLVSPNDKVRYGEPLFTYPG
jgi:phosphatidylserine decarboxylase